MTKLLENKKIYIVNGPKSYVNWLINAGITIVDYIEDSDLVMFTGGEDVNPKLYDQLPNVKTHYNNNRDIVEVLAFKKAKQLNKPCIGICRGAQFLTVMSGGKLIQHVENHGRRHLITFCDNSRFEVTSTHHQMMFPFELDSLDYNILGWAYQVGDGFENETDKETVFPDTAYFSRHHCDPIEPEVVFYPKTNCLCIQSHPEMMDFESEAVIKFTNLVSAFLNNEIIF